MNINTQLYNAFIRAKNFFITDENNRAKIENYRGQIMVSHGRLNTPPISPPARKEVDYHFEIVCGLPFLYIFASLMLSMIFDLGIENARIEDFLYPVLLYIPLAILYVLFRLTKAYLSRKRDLKRYQKELRQAMASPEYIKHCEDMRNEISRLQTLLAQAIQEQNAYYRNNYHACLGFIENENYRTLPDIEAMLSYAKTGQARTYHQAAALRARDYRIMYSESEKLEKEAEERRRYEESQKLQAEILAEQKKISDEIEYQRLRRTFKSRF